MHYDTRLLIWSDLILSKIDLFIISWLCSIIVKDCISKYLWSIVLLFIVNLLKKSSIIDLYQILGTSVTFNFSIVIVEVVTTSLW